MPGMSEKTVLLNYSKGEMTALEARRRLGNVGFGDLLRLLADAGMPLPRSPIPGREEALAQARAWLFPKVGQEA